MQSPNPSLIQSPNPTLPQREGVADFSPSLWGRVGVGLLCLLLCGCITEYHPKGLDEITDILVVEGIITDDVSHITLSWSINLTDGKNNWTTKQYVENATVSVECDDGTKINGYFDWSSSAGRYIINTGTLKPELQYCLKIEVDEREWGSTLAPIKTFKYSSDFSYPIQTPEIDSIFWTKRGKGQPVMIYVATNDQAGKVQYYRWSYKEDWEYHADLYHADYPFYCWEKDNNKELMLGSAEKTVYGKVTEKIIEIEPWSKKISELYRIDVTQNVISKRAYDYFANIKKNAQQTGSIFAPIPSELRGNISCITDPERPVIGYIDVSTTTKKRRYIPYEAGIYEHPGFNGECEIVPGDSLRKWYPVPPNEQWAPPYIYVLYSPPPPPPPIRPPPEEYVLYKCVACTYYTGTEQRPEDWPNNH